VINPGKTEPVAAMMEATGGKGAQVILEATGNTRVIPQAFKMTAFGGRVVCVGVMEEPYPMALHKDFIQRELSLIAAFQPFCPTVDTIYWHWTQQANRELLLELMAQGKLRVEEMITHRFPANQAPAAYEKIRVGDTEMLGAILQW
jgi:threonine dehydrogenase-like Zn-dependent dehydrogenase